MTRTIKQYMETLTADDVAIYARVVERANGYLPMIAADTRDAEIMRHLAEDSGFAPHLVAKAPRFKVAAIVANNAPTEYGVFDMADRRTFNGKLRHKYATEYHAEQMARALNLHEVQS